MLLGEFFLDLFNESGTVLFFAALDGEGGQRPSELAVHLGGGTGGMETSERKGGASVALLCGKGVKLAGFFVALLHSRTALEESGEVILRSGKTTLGSAGEPRCRSGDISQAELTGKIEQPKFVLRLHKSSIGSC